MEEYWSYMEKIRETCYGTKTPEGCDHELFEFYDKERLDGAQDLLDRAVAQAAEGPEVYRQRIAFVQAGLDFTRLVTECGRLVRDIKQNLDCMTECHPCWLPNILDHHLEQKGTFFECSARVPLLFSGPGMPQGKVVSENGGLVDLKRRRSRIKRM